MAEGCMDSRGRRFITENCRAGAPELTNVFTVKRATACLKARITPASHWISRPPRHACLTGPLNIRRLIIKRIYQSGLPSSMIEKKERADRLLTSVMSPESATRPSIRRLPMDRIPKHGAFCIPHLDSSHARREQRVRPHVCRSPFCVALFCPSSFRAEDGVTFWTRGQTRQSTTEGCKPLPALSKQMETPALPVSFGRADIPGPTGHDFGIMGQLPHDLPTGASPNQTTSPTWGASTEHPPGRDQTGCRFSPFAVAARWVRHHASGFSQGCRRRYRGPLMTWCQVGPAAPDAAGRDGISRCTACLAPGTREGLHALPFQATPQVYRLGQAD